MKKILIHTLNNVEVPRYRTRDYNIPKLIGYDITKVEVVAANGIVQGIKETTYEGKYTIEFIGQSPNSIIQLEIYVYEADQVEEVVELEAPKADPPVEKKDKKGWLAKLQKQQAERMAVKKKEIMEASAIYPRDLKNMKVLTFDQTNSWSRALGMIQKAKQLEHQIGMPLYRYYDRITGQGDGAIIATAIAGMIPLQELGEWWTKEWRDVHTPGMIQGFARKAATLVKPNESGFNAKAARKELQKLFTSNDVPLRMRDCGTQLHITVMQADLKIFTHQSDKNSDIELWAVCEDSAITKYSYNQKETIKGEAIFLEFVEKNDVLGLTLAANNDGIKITSIGAPVRIAPESARKLVKLGHAADKVTQRDASHFVFDKRVQQAIEKNNIKCYLRLECLPIDNIVLNSTTDNALKCGIESGSGQIELPVWFKATITRQIA